MGRKRPARKPGKTHKTHVRPAVANYRGSWLHPPRRVGTPPYTDGPAIRRWLSNTPRPWAVDLFSGAGGLSLGLIQAGINVIAAADSDVAAIETHSANLGGLAFEGDLSDAGEFLGMLECYGIDHVEVVAGGPPCQPFSRAGMSKIRDLVQTGSRSEDDPRTRLWVAFVDVVDALRPEVVLFENVPDLAAWDDGAVLIELMSSLAERGYSTDARILDAYRFGVPQHRARLFVVGTLAGNAFVWPSASAKSTTLKEAIGDLPKVGPAQREERLKYGAPKTSFQRRLRHGVSRDERDAIFDHVTRDVRPDDAEAFALLLPGQTYKDLPKRLQRYRSDIFRDKYKRLRWDEVSRTITAHIAKDGYWYIHPSEDRTLSIREAARVQTFPDWFRFAGFPSDRWRQIGNAVPPLLAEKVGKNVFEFLQGSTGRRNESSGAFRERLLHWHEGQVHLVPWRTSLSDPWAVLAGELVLLRVAHDRRAALYSDLLDLAPSPKALLRRIRRAESWAKEERLEVGIARLLEAARVIVDDLGGEVPEMDLALRSIPGVGDRSTNAVRAFGFGRTAVLMDAGTRRVVGRVTKRKHLHAWQIRLEVLKLAGQPGPDAAFSGAITDFAHRVCTREKPDCAGCPVKQLCATGRKNVARRADPNGIT